MAPLKYHRPPGPSTPEAPCAWSTTTGARRAPTARCLRFPLRSRSARRRLPHRKRKRKDRPLAYRAHDRYLAAVELHEPPGKRGPETGPLVLPRQVGAHLAERLEDLRLVLRRDAGMPTGGGEAREPERAASLPPRPNCEPLRCAERHAVNPILYRGERPAHEHSPLPSNRSPSIVSSQRRGYARSALASDTRRASWPPRP